MKINVLKNLESLPFFTKVALMNYDEKIGSKALYQNIGRWIQRGLLIRLKNGLYVTKTYVDRSSHDERYFVLIANRLLFPSYVSLEYVLQKHGLLTEGVKVITSVTTKTTRRYSNTLGIFSYSTVSSELHFGFVRERYGKNIIFEAVASKALFDYLYLRLSYIDPKKTSTLDELRLNWSNLRKETFKDFCDVIIKSNVKKMIRMIPLFEDYYGKTH